MKNLIDKLQKHERSIAAVVFLIGILMIVSYVYAAVLYINSETDQINQKLSAIMIEGTGEVYTADYSLDILTDENGNEYIDEFALDSITRVKYEDGKYFVLDSVGNTIDETEFLDDNGNRLTVSAKNGKISFKNSDNKAVSEFVVNTHKVTVKNGIIIVDGISFKTSQNTTVPKTTQRQTENTTQVATKATTKQTVATTTTTTAAPVVVAEDPQPVQVQTTTTTRQTFPEYYPSDSYVAEVLRLVNIERRNNGLNELKAIYSLDQAALVRAKEIVSVQDHIRVDGSAVNTVLSDYGLSYRYMGENISCGSETPAEVVNDWMNSSAHRANILNPDYEYMGTGHVYVDDDSNLYFDYWVQLFYTPL